MKDYEPTILAEKFTWNDNKSCIAQEDFRAIQKQLPYCIARSIGDALEKLRILEEQGCRVEKGDEE